LDLPLRNPQSLRPWMHVSDAVSALMTLAEALIVKGPKANGSWNFSGGENNFASVAAVKEIFEKAYGKNSAADVVAEKSSIAVSVHSGVDISKAKEQLGWEPRVSVAEAVAQTAMWYKNFYR
ncbi:MAG TPA: hypothetical protein VN132_16755, partial [Bdellovibrio sp.]|nr:hypothetical protein [Bdellovibrio sp.]